MDSTFQSHIPQFFTATVYQWNHLLRDDKHKEIIVDSLRFLTHQKRIELHAFVIMSSHIHLIWQTQEGHSPKSVQAAFMKYTAQQLKHSLTKSDPHALAEFKVNKFDREYQIWKREPLSVGLITHELLWQKLGYIHQNSVKAGLCKSAEEYYYSSARFYFDGIDTFQMLTHISGN